MKKLYLCWALLGLLIAPFTRAQSNVTGTVNDETGAPLPGATVIVEGTWYFSRKQKFILSIYN